jgi:ribose 5-phosphate isomerase B
MKGHVVRLLEREGIDWLDLGPATPDSVDYADFAAQVAGGVTRGRFGAGILICGSGQGMAITANRFPGARATLCLNSEMARLARQHNDSNILVLAGRMTSKPGVTKLLKTWLETEFEGGRHQRRLELIETCAGRAEPTGKKGARGR